MTFGQRLRQARQQKGMLMRELAAELGMDQPYISALETDKVSAPRIETVAKLARALDVTIDWLWYGDDEAEAELAVAREG